MWRHAQVFLAILAWDFLATVDVRLIAGGRLWAVPLAGVFATLWFLSTSWIVGNPRVLPAAVVASMLGTWAGVSV